MATLSPTAPPAFTIHQVPVNGWPFLHAALDASTATYVADMQANADLQTELDRMGMQEWLAALKASRSWLGLPLRVGEHTVGLLNILHDAADQYAASDIELAQTFANQLAVAIHNIQLSAQARQSAAADERSRIARELHDSVTQTLFTASVLAEATPRIWHKDQGIALQNMDRLSLLIRGALAEMRSLLLELRSDGPPNQTLEQLLNTLAEATRARSNIAVTLSCQGNRELPAAVTMTFYRIAQEALNNVIKHAEATAVHIALLGTPEGVELQIHDDGRGLIPRSFQPGIWGSASWRSAPRRSAANCRFRANPVVAPRSAWSGRIRQRGQTMTESASIRVMIVNDHPIVRDGLKNMLLAFDDLQLVGAAADGAEALVCCQQQRPDVILMDMVMPGMDGIAATRAILEQQPEMKIIMLTSFVEDSAVQRALEAGAVGYLMKNVAINTMAEAIRAAYAGQPSLSPEATAALIRVKTGPRTPGSDLSERERQVLALIVGA